LIDQATLDSPEGTKRYVKGITTHSQEQHNKSDLEERFRTDTQVRHFKKWIPSYDQPQVTNFFKRFLADGQLPERTSRGLYEAKIHSSGNYSDEDIQLFQDAWRSMIAEDLEYMPLWLVILILCTSGSRHTHQRASVLGRSLYDASPSKTTYTLRT
jgi:hypothetical protein